MKYMKVLLITLIVLTTLCCNIEIVEGIIGGQDVVSNHFKYQISLQANNEHICGGALISKQHALTAANCLIGNDEKFIDRKYIIVAGVNNLKSEESGKVEVNVERIYVPTEFKRTNSETNPTSSHNKYYSVADLAVLKLATNLLQINPELKVVSLPDMNMHHPKYEGRRTLISGFGIENFISRGDDKGYGQYCSKLKFAEAYILNRKMCCRKLKFDLDARHLCAEVAHHTDNRIEGVCDGDIGGPLIVQGMTIVGILSYHSTDCNEKINPALYTRISDFMPFINDAMNDEFKDGTRMAFYQNKVTSFRTYGAFEEKLIEMFRFI